MLDTLCTELSITAHTYTDTHRHINRQTYTDTHRQTYTDRQTDM